MPETENEIPRKYIRRNVRVLFDIAEEIRDEYANRYNIIKDLKECLPIASGMVQAEVNERLKALS